MMPKCIPTSIPAPRSTLDGQKVAKILQKLNNWRPICAEIVDFDRHLGALWGQRGLQNLIFLLKLQENSEKGAVMKKKLILTKIDAQMRSLGKAPCLDRHLSLHRLARQWAAFRRSTLPASSWEYPKGFRSGS